MVYFLRMAGTDYYKIGYTSRAEAGARLAELQTACPRKLEVVAVIEGSESVEAEFHRRFWQYRTDGGAEWFEIPEDKARGFTNGNAKQDEYRGAVGGIAAFDVRPVRWRQQYTATRSGEDVPDAGYGANYARAQYPQFVGSRKHEIGMPTIFRQERQDDSAGNQQLYDDKPV